MHLQHVERVPEHEQLGFGVHDRPLRGRTDPGRADLDAVEVPAAARPALRVEERRGADDSIVLRPVLVDPHRREREPAVGRVLRDHGLDVASVRGLTVGDRRPVVRGAILRCRGVERGDVLECQWFEAHEASRQHDRLEDFHVHCGFDLRPSITTTVGALTGPPVCAGLFTPMSRVPR